MHKTEAKNNTILNQYLREKRKEGFYCYYELKIVRGNKFNFRQIETNQDEGLPALQKEGLVWKWSDEDSRKKPCDGGSLPPLPSYLVLKFTNIFYFVNYEQITRLKNVGVKSISLEDCKNIAEKVLHI